MTADHPHAGGENLRPLTERRGVSDHPHAGGENGAHAEEDVRDPDHPHAGGENHRTGHHTRGQPGPSPRGWGKLTVRSFSHAGARTIPTRVGKTSSTRRSWELTADHPHAGGENRWRDARDEIEFGPSPRGWGKPYPARQAGLASRTIPTRVGRTAIASRAPPQWPDHPHAGGENQRRGKARASRPADHPHAGGENSSQCRWQNPWLGPSPRGWGEPGDMYVKQAKARTIPTRVGRTQRPGLTLC